VATSEAVIAGTHVSVTSVMMCTRSWLQTYYYDPIAQFRALVEPGRFRRCFAGTLRFLNCLFPVTSKDAHQRCLAWQGLFIFVPILLWLIVVLCFYARPWVKFNTLTPPLFIALAILTILIGYPGRYLTWEWKELYIAWFGIMSLIWGLQLVGAIVSFMMTGFTYEDAFEDIWEYSEYLDMRKKLEEQYNCTGWCDELELYGCHLPQACNGPLMEQVGVLAIILGTGLLFMTVTMPVILYTHRRPDNWKD
jgi:amino acid transporter